MPKSNGEKIVRYTNVLKGFSHDWTVKRALKRLYELAHEDGTLSFFEQQKSYDYAKEFEFHDPEGKYAVFLLRKLRIIGVQTDEDSKHRAKTKTDVGCAYVDRRLEETSGEPPELVLSSVLESENELSSLDSEESFSTAPPFEKPTKSLAEKLDCQEVETQATSSQKTPKSIIEQNDYSDMFTSKRTRQKMFSGSSKAKKNSLLLPASSSSTEVFKQALSDFNMEQLAGLVDKNPDLTEDAEKVFGRQIDLKFPGRTSEKLIGMTNREFYFSLVKEKNAEEEDKLRLFKARQLEKKNKTPARKTVMIGNHSRKFPQEPKKSMKFSFSNKRSTISSSSIFSQRTIPTTQLTSKTFSNSRKRPSTISKEEEKNKKQPSALMKNAQNLYKKMQQSNLKSPY